MVRRLLECIAKSEKIGLVIGQHRDKTRNV
jgi:hypothetical protein